VLGLRLSTQSLVTLVLDKNKTAYLLTILQTTIGLLGLYKTSPERFYLKFAFIWGPYSTKDRLMICIFLQ